MSITNLLNRCGINFIIGSVRVNESDVNDAGLILDSRYQTIRIAFDIEDYPIISEETSVPIIGFDIGGSFPSGTFHTFIPHLKRLLRVRMLLPEFPQCSA